MEAGFQVGGQVGSSGGDRIESRPRELNVAAQASSAHHPWWIRRECSRTGAKPRTGLAPTNLEPPDQRLPPPELSRHTRVLCSVCLEVQVPRWRRSSGLGWLRAGYRLLPVSTPSLQSR
jgi:hypothetical protein